jgi:hypothetical protein
MPQMSPAGNELMFLTNISGRPQPWLIDLKTTVGEYLFSRPNLGPGYTFPSSPNMTLGTIPQWSPNGSQILMLSSNNGTAGRLYVVTLDFPVAGSDLSGAGITPGTIYYFNVYNLAPLNTLLSSVRWIPDGKGIALLSSISSQVLIIQSGPPARIGYGG